MTYTPINWQTGDTITAEKMNKMDNGWSVSQSTQQLFSGSVTTEDDGGEAWGTLPYNGVITADSLAVTFAGVLYDCPRQAAAFGAVYGGWDGSAVDFSEIPFAIFTSGNEIMTANVGTFAISAAVASDSVEASAEFQRAVAYAGALVATANVTTWQEVYDAMSAGKVVFVKVEDVSGTVEHRHVLLASSSGYEVFAAYADGGSIGLAYFTAQSADSPIMSS